MSCVLLVCFYRAVLCACLFVAECSDLSDAYISRVSAAIALQVRSADELAVSLGVRINQHTAYGSLKEQLVHLLTIWRDTKNGSKQRLVSILQQHHLVQESTRSHQHPKKGVCVM